MACIGRTQTGSDPDKPRGETLYRIGFERAGIGQALVRLDGRILKVNRALATLIGADPRDIEGRDLCGLAHPDDRALCRSKMAALRASRDAVRFELRLAWDAEHEVWADLHLAVIEDPDDADPGCIACILDADRDPLTRRDGAAHPDLMPLTNALAVELATSPLLSDIR